MDPYVPGDQDRDRAPPASEEGERTRRRVAAEREFLLAREAWFNERRQRPRRTLSDAIRRAREDREPDRS